jgi:hypothetical protein
MATAAILVVAVFLVAAAEVFLHRVNGQERALLAQAPAAAAAAGCGEVKVTPPYPGGLDRTHVGGKDLPRMPALSSYPSTPPASGPHGAAPLGAGFYPSAPPLDGAIHSLEHAAVTVWLDPSVVSSSQGKAIERFFAQGGERNHVIVAPYDYPTAGDAGKLPGGEGMALVAWHHVRYCAQPSLPVAFDFVHSYRFNLYQRGAYRGDAPEKFAPI